MLFLLFRYQPRHINHTSIHISTSILGGQWWHGIWRIRWSPTRYWRSLRLWHCIMLRFRWLLTNWGEIRWITDWVIAWRMHMYHRWWQLIAILVTVLAIKAPVITRSFMWRDGWILTNWGQLRCIDDWIIQWRRHMYHRRWQIISIWVTFLEIKALIITRSFFVPTLIVTCSTFVVTTNDLCTWHDECNMSLWWSCVTVILFVDGQKRWEPMFWRDNCSHVWVYVPGIKLITSFLSQYNTN